MSVRYTALGMMIVILLTVLIAVVLYYTDARLPVRDPPSGVEVPRDTLCMNLTYNIDVYEGANFSITRSVNGGEAWLCCDTWGYCFWSEVNVTTEDYKGVISYV